MENDNEMINPRRISYLIAFVITVGTVFYHYVEGLRWLDSLYFSVITLTTIGYGDIVPKTDAGKLFTICYVLIGVGIIAASLNYLVRHRREVRVERRTSNVEAELKSKIVK